MAPSSIASSRYTKCASCKTQRSGTHSSNLRLGTLRLGTLRPATPRPATLRSATLRTGVFTLLPLLAACGSFDSDTDGESQATGAGSSNTPAVNMMTTTTAGSSAAAPGAPADMPNASPAVPTTDGQGATAPAASEPGAESQPETSAQPTEPAPGAADPGPVASDEPVAGADDETPADPMLGAGGATAEDPAPEEAGGSPGAGGEMGAGGEPAADVTGAEDDGSMSFFVTSVGGPDGGNLGGLEGADAFCTELATAVSAELGAKPWRAYLSTSEVNARDRIGLGPWRNANGDIVANDVEELHDQDDGALDATWPPADLSIALTELGDEVENSEHDMLTGSLVDGTWDEGLDCQGWTSNSADEQASVGHSNRDGGGRPPYFNATHQVGCAPTEGNYEQGTVSSGGGRGSFYCFVPIGE